MDRTEASDAFNAGSIPVGHIPPPCKITDSEVIMKFKSNIKIIIPICVIVIVAISVAAALITREDAVLANETSTGATTEETIAAISADNPLEGDKYPEINELVVTYLNALADGDVDTISGITNEMTDIQRIRIEELGKCIESFPEYNVFTKIGPTEDSYIVYAAVRPQFEGLDVLVPGIYCFYVCKDADGEYYFNEAVLSEEEQVYIDAINADDTVVNLMKSIEEEYQELLASNDTVANYIELMQNEIRGAVGTALASASTETISEEGADDTDPTVLYSACKATTTDTINVRSSDSETADKLGKIAKGTTIDVIEVRVNGWTKINYEGSEAYVKTDYLQIEEEPEKAGEGDNVANGTVTTTDTVNIRAKADAASTKLGQVTAGTKLEWIADVDGGFSKIIYEGQVGYIATEYLQK